jgi:ADP-ribose pyrophosphatase YjhB (NUDIX family)
MAVSGILVEGDSILLAGRGGTDGEVLWAPPGGKVELGESLRGAVAREFLEETGMVVTVTRAVGYLELWLGPVRFALWVWLVEKTLPGLPEPLAGGDAHGVRFYRLSTLTAQDLAPGVAQMLDHLGLW